MEYLELIDKYREEMVHMLQELIAIPSVEGKRETDAPFGKSVADAFQYMLKKGEAQGFETQNIDNYGGHIGFGGYTLDKAGEIIGTNLETIGILGHLDVVPEGKNWDVPPFSGEVIDGKVYGRGAADDKGPVVAAFYAMKALKDAGFVPEKKVRLILGLDEETNWIGMEKYFKKVKAPEFAFTPDGDFPVIHGEKGILIFELAKKMAKTQAKGLELRTVTGGNAANMVADNARAVLRGDSYDKVKEEVALFRKETGYQINAKGIGKSLEITTQGISSHGARPESGLNAISIMMLFLGRLGIVNEDMKEFIEFYNKHIGFELDGTSLGCGFSDEESGHLISNVGLVEIDDQAARVTINMRYPVTIDDEAVYASMMPLINAYNLGVVKLDHKAPIFMAKDNPMIVSLMEVYQKHTGDLESQPMVIGGGTYARAMENAVAFGATFPGEEEVAHQKNEYISIDSMVKACKIYADAIAKLSLL